MMHIPSIEFAVPVPYVACVNETLPLQTEKAGMCCNRQQFTTASQRRKTELFVRQSNVTKASFHVHLSFFETSSFSNAYN